MKGLSKCKSWIINSIFWVWNFWSVWKIMFFRCTITYTNRRSCQFCRWSIKVLRLGLKISQFGTKYFFLICKAICVSIFYELGILHVVYLYFTCCVSVFYELGILHVIWNMCVWRKQEVHVHWSQISVANNPTGWKHLEYFHLLGNRFLPFLKLFPLEQGGQIFNQFFSEAQCISSQARRTKLWLETYFLSLDVSFPLKQGGAKTWTNSFLKPTIFFSLARWINIYVPERFLDVKYIFSQDLLLDSSPTFLHKRGKRQK